MDKKHCSGCRDDFYNDNNPLGVKKCWHLPRAKLVRRVAVHVNQRPPWTQKPVRVPNCYHMVCYIHVDPNNPGCTKRAQPCRKEDS